MFASPGEWPDTEKVLPEAGDEPGEGCMVLGVLHGSIRKKLIILFLLSALPAFLIILVTGVQNRAKAIAGAERELLAFVHQTANAQERTTLATRLLLESLARMPEVRQRDVAACSKLFSNVLNTNPLYGALHLVVTRGDLVASNRPVPCTTRTLRCLACLGTRSMSQPSSGSSRLRVGGTAWSISDLMA